MNIIIYDYDNSHAYNNYDIIVVIAHVFGPACLYISIFLLTWNSILLVFYRPKYHLQRSLPLTINWQVYVDPRCCHDVDQAAILWPRPNLISLRQGYKLILFIDNSFTKFNPFEKEFKSQSSKIYTRGRFNVYGIYSWEWANTCKILIILFQGRDTSSV